MNPTTTTNERRITHEKDYAIGYDCGYSQGYRAGVLDGWARGYDEAVREVRGEE